MRGRFVTKPARSKMHADPDSVLLVREKIDIMISAADRPELLRRDRFQIADWFELPRRIVEQLVLDASFTFAPDPERDVAHDVVHDLVDLRRDIRATGVGQDGDVAARNVEP